MKGISVKKGKGVLGKDKQPFNPGNMYIERIGTHPEFGRMPFRTPIGYSITGLCEALKEPLVETIVVVTEENVQYTIKPQRSK